MGGLIFGFVFVNFGMILIFCWVGFIVKVDRCMFFLVWEE